MIDPCRRLAFVLMSSVLVLGLIGSAGCSGGGSTSSQGGDAAKLIEVETSQLFITVRNQSSRPLVEITVAVVPQGGATLFSTSIARMEMGEKRDLMLSLFRSRDGTLLNLNVVKPKSVRVTAKDLDGKPYEVETPFRR